MIHLPELNLEVYEFEEDRHWGAKYYRFLVKENVNSISVNSRYPDENYFLIRPPPLPNPGVSLNLKISCKDSDSLYFINYRAEHSYK